MHEVGIISSILKTVEKIMVEENLTEVVEIVMDVGELSGVVPHYMTECFPAAAYKTKFEKTKFTVNVIPGDVRCDSCGKVFNGYKHDLVCPNCGETKKLTPLTGRELLIKEIKGK